MIVSISSCSTKFQTIHRFFVLFSSNTNAKKRISFVYYCCCLFATIDVDSILQKKIYAKNNL